MIIVLSYGITLWMFYEIFKKCIENKKVYINHIFCFTLGFFYYGILPVLIFELNIKFDDYAYNAISKIYYSLTLHSKLTYIGILYLIYGFFILGNKLSIFKLSVKKRSLLTEKSFHFSEKIWFVLAIFLGIWCIYLNKSHLLKGYTAGHSQFKGMYSTFISLLFSLLLLYGIGGKRKIPSGGEIKNKWTLCYGVFALLLLSMGGRLYIITNIMAFLVFISIYYKQGIKIKDIFLIGSMIIFGVGIIGIIRLGNEIPITLNRILFNMLQESLYESYSLVTYLKKYEILNYISVPTVLTSSFINIIPSVIWNNKTSYMTDIYDIVPAVQSPLGGMHFYVSFIADAGVLITLLGITILGIFLGKIYQNKRKNSDTKNVIYCLISANLMFTFYRDPVSVSLVKNIFENSILIPCFIMFINNILSNMTKQSK